MISESATVFARLVGNWTANGRHRAPLRNICFFLGAGFSKAWSQRYPGGKELFEFTRADRKECNELNQYLATTNYEDLEVIDYNVLREIVYQLGMYKKYPATRTRYIDDAKIDLIETDLRWLIVARFRRLQHAWSDRKEKFVIPYALNTEQEAIASFFLELMTQGDASRGYAEGIRVHYLSTNYDNLLETILDNGLPDDESVLQYSYRGITPRRVNGQNNPFSMHNIWLVNSLFKLNGGFEIFRDDGGYEIDYRNTTALRPNDRMPELMLPSKEQNYAEEYFQSIFPKAIRILQEAAALVIVGYSMPEEDALLRFLIKQFAAERTDGSGRFVFYVDKMSVLRQRERIASIWPHTKEQRGLTLHTYYGEFAQWATDVKRLLQAEDPLRHKA